MKLVQLDEKIFDEFSKEHVLGTFYQTSSYAKVMKEQGMQYLYLGMISDSNKIKAATLVLVQEKKSIFGKIRNAYCPRGFLIDYDDLELLKLWSSELKKYLKKQKIVYLRVDPPIENVKRLDTGEIDYNGFNNYHVIENLNASGFKHLGFNKGFETLKPRWNVILRVKGSSKDVFEEFGKDIKSKIRKSQNMGVNVIKGTSEDLQKFYSYVAKKHTRNLKYYQDFYKIFKENDMCELYFAHLDSQKFLERSREQYDEELIRNNALLEQMQNNKQGSLESIINKKMVSDAAISQYKENIVTATKVLGLYPEGITLSTSFIIKYKSEIFFLIDGFNKNSEIVTSTNLLRYEIMKHYIDKGYNIINMNGITGNFNPKNKYYGLYKSKIGYGGDVVEYIGEFDLVIKRFIYNIYRYIKPLQSYLKKDMKE